MILEVQRKKYIPLNDLKRSLCETAFAHVKYNLSQWM